MGGACRRCVAERQRGPQCAGSVACAMLLVGIRSSNPTCTQSRVGKQHGGTWHAWGKHWGHRKAAECLSALLHDRLGQAQPHQSCCREHGGANLLTESKSSHSICCRVPNPSESVGQSTYSAHPGCRAMAASCCFPLHGP